MEASSHRDWGQVALQMGTAQSTPQPWPRGRDHSVEPCCTTGYKAHQTSCTLLSAPRPALLFDPCGEGMMDPYAEIFYLSFHQFVSSKGPWVGDRSPQTKISAVGLCGPLHDTF